MRDRLMVALDMPDRARALAMRDAVGDAAGWMKVGMRLFVAEGPDLVRELLGRHRVFLDLKFHDIPNTVAQAVESAGQLGVQMVNVHTSGGLAMMEAAAGAAAAFPGMLLIGVTVLTSDTRSAEEALRLAQERAVLAKRAGLHGVVCSAHEVRTIKAECGEDFLTVTPGIRWGGQDRQDQQRIADPAMAVREGADYLVVGRPILQAASPRRAAEEAVAMMMSSDG
ncbi:MAG TPA: orotidine-5'-phosphate decarboxylase [Mariprofundaceae bacterium]|nr:orotidine-5'-phosphate decarboxylase [Mariprofundaceae bacterium]